MIYEINIPTLHALTPRRALSPLHSRHVATLRLQPRWQWRPRQRPIHYICPHHMLDALPNLRAPVLQVVLKAERPPRQYAYCPHLVGLV